MLTLVIIYFWVRTYANMQVRFSSNRYKNLMDVALRSQEDIIPGRVMHEGRGHGAYSAYHTFMILVALREILTALDQQLA